MATIGMLLWLRQHAPGCPHFVGLLDVSFVCVVVVLVVAVAMAAATAAAAAAAGGGGGGGGGLWVCFLLWCP